jgi:hypothetical protein
MVTTIRSTDLIKVANNVKPDAKKRVVLPTNLVQKDVTYAIYYTKIGQIVLDPQVTIPASELWLFEDKDALALVDRGMAETESISLGSFARYIKDAP